MSASLNSLPNDLLKSIFELFPQYPRLQVVSRVCKRWRTLVLQTGFTLRNCADWERASMLLCITSFELCDDFVPRTFAHSLKDITINNASDEALTYLAQHARSLHAVALTESISAGVAALLASAAATLTSLTALNLEEDAFERLQSLHLPHLKKLKFDFVTTYTYHRRGRNASPVRCPKLALCVSVCLLSA